LKIFIPKYCFLIFLLTLFGITACLEDFEPGRQEDFAGNISVAGWLTNLPEQQIITLSTSVPVNTSIPDPISHYHIEVQDNIGNSFFYEEIHPGTYAHNYSTGELQPGRFYKLVMISAEGRIYESEFTEMLPFAEDCSLKYQKDSIETRDIGVSVPGLQFYSDFSSGEEGTRFYKADIWETWEFHTLYNEAYWIRQGILELVPQDSIREICYRRSKVPDIFIIDTRNLVEKKIPDYPLHFVSNQTQRLKYGYMAELRILSLTETAYRYWENQKLILEESGGLLDRQPPENLTNIYSLHDPYEKVIGFFGASSVSSQRIFLPRGVLSEFDIEPYCVPIPLKSYTLNQLYRNHLRISYFVNVGRRDNPPNLYKASKDCFDCTVFTGSTTEIPEHWNHEK
jgi:hypothetical protein